MKLITITAILMMLVPIAIANITYVQHDYNDFGLTATDDIGTSGQYIGDFDSDTLHEVALSLQEINVGLGGFIMVEFMTNGSVNSYTIFDNSSIPINLISGDKFGSDIDTIGDFDGDNVTDLIISGLGQQYATYSPFYNGAIYLVLMNSNYTIKQVKEISSESGGFSNASRDSYDYIGTCLTNLGDVDNDGVNDIMFSKGTSFSNGGLYVVLLNSDFTVKSSQFINKTSFGSDTSNFGSGCKGVGDVSGDNIPDFLVNGGGNIFLGTLKTDGTLLSYAIYNETTLVGSEQISFGNGISNYDMNNDSITDYLTGNGDSAGGDYSLVMLMNPTGTVNDTLKIDTVGIPNDDFGANQMPLGDLNNDGFQDMLVIANEVSELNVFFLNITNQASQSYPNTTLQCDDNIDNDGDGLIDYPEDPSCSSLTDNTEAPFDTVQCNDEIDNDLDGFTDYPNDPSCSSASDTTETPADASLQSESECLETAFCLRKDFFPYTDDIMFHGWSSPTDDGNGGTVSVYNRRLYEFNNLGVFRFNITTNITNVNNYENVIVNFELWNDIISGTDGDDIYEYFVTVEDYDGRDLALLKIATREDSGDRIISVSYQNGSGFEELSEFVTGGGLTSWFLTSIKFFQQLKEFTVTFITTEEVIVVQDIQPFTDTFASKVHTFTVDTGNYSSDKWILYLDQLEIRADSTDFADSVCDEWKNPYNLVESFIGYPSECDWVVSEDIFFDGELSIEEATEFYSQEKYFDPVASDTNSQYLTLTYDLNVIYVVTGSTITLRMYDDDDNYNFFTVFYRDSGEDLWYNEDGTGKVAQSGIPLNQTISYKFVIDYDADSYDIYYNGSKVVSNTGLTDRFFNLENANRFKLQSNDATFKMDNIKIFASDSNGVPLSYDEDAVLPIQNDTKYCGLFFVEDVQCTSDAECESGACLPNGKCNRFDMTYCDENGHQRGSKCYVSAVASCVLTSTGDLILSNFWLFLVLIIILMGLAYAFIIVTRSR